MWRYKYCLASFACVLFAFLSSKQCSGLSVSSSSRRASGNYDALITPAIRRHKESSITALHALNVRGGQSKDDSADLPMSQISKVTQSISDGYRARLAADPNFLLKSFLEVALAAATQFTAELNRRGASGCITEIDFVVAGVLTAIAGKYYSMWRVAPTTTSSNNDTEKDLAKTAEKLKPKPKPTGFWANVPNNAFQTYHLDGVTRPTMVERLASFIAPVPNLFRAGVVASAIGYGLTYVLIALRTLLVPNYVAQTVNVNIVYACLYTGAFMSVVSNIRYQLLSGIIEPRIIDRYFQRWPPLQAALTFGVRLANGLLGSMIAIAGMKWLGLQKLKS